MPSTNTEQKLEKQKHGELAGFFANYLQVCRREQVIDYNDQLYLTVEMLKHRPNILKQLQERFRYILVDEFQDTNPMQSQLVDLLAGNMKNIMVVGDDDQSIYGWRGATLANILDFKTRYPEAREVTLPENYRSTQTILDCAYRLIQHNNPDRLEVINQLDKRLHGQLDGPAPLLQHFSSHEAELAWLVEDIRKRLDGGAAPGSIAVLARRNEGVQKVHNALELHGISHSVAGYNNDIYTKNVVRQLIEALKAVADPHDDMALFHTLSGPLFNLEIGKLADVASSSRRHHQPLGETITGSEVVELKHALRQIESWRQQAAEQSVGSVAYAMVKDSGWLQALYLRTEKSSADITDIQALSKYFATLKEFERIAGAASAQSYILNLPALQAAGTSFDDPTMEISTDEINVLSIHRAKGLEWETVYLVDCTEGSFPLRSRGINLSVPEELLASPSKANEHMAEERRLMYVAVTRAGLNLILSYADRHGSGAKRKPSRFLAELIGKDPNVAAVEESTPTELQLFAPAPNAHRSAELPEKIYKDGYYSLNVSEIESWLRCPQDFYYKYVLNMPLPPAPQLAYGSLIHSVIEQIHLGRQNGMPPSLEELTTEVMANLPRIGYLSKRSRERYHSQAPKTVQAIYERFSSDELPVETEWPFELDVPDLPLKIRGKIDAVYQLTDGCEIRDFKTGTSVRTLEQAKNRVAGSQQLTLYAYAWQQLRGEMPAKLSLDFVETGQSYGVKKQAKSLETLHQKLTQMIKDLQAGSYPSGRDHSHCMHPVES
jgi:DNA helicase-2/ATP-dependent DNA helicase PcrA